MEITAKELRHRLRVKFEQGVPLPQHVVFDEVRVDRSATDWGGHGFRAADAFAVGLWRKTGFTIHGFEIKVNRADWKQELREPAKAASSARYCHHWWLVVSDLSIVEDGELPEGWGLLAPHGRGLRIVTEAPLREPITDPSFVARLVACALRQHRACRGFAKLVEYERGWDLGYKAGINRGRLEARREIAR